MGLKLGIPWSKAIIKVGSVGYQHGEDVKDLELHQYQVKKNKLTPLQFLGQSRWHSHCHIGVACYIRVSGLSEWHSHCYIG
jgi:hypothetical protein